MNNLNIFNNIFKDVLTYKFINSINKVKMRNIKNGITLTDAVYYKFYYCKKEITKLLTSSKINMKCSNIFEQTSYDRKENNISCDVYNTILTKIVDFYKSNCLRSNNEYIFVAVDGSSSNDNKQNIILNMGYYDITNNIPINITFEGKENRNKEVSSFIKHIKNDIDRFKNTVFVCDRLYFTYELLHFLNEHDLKYIIRVKGNGDNLNQECMVNKNIKHYKMINELRKNSRLIKCNNTYIKNVYK